MQGAPSYLSFNRSNRNDLAAPFIADPSNAKLAKIFKEHKQGLSKCTLQNPDCTRCNNDVAAIKFYECHIPNIYLVILRGNYDGILIELGKKYKFPR